MQIADIVFAEWGFPSWALRTLIAIAALGFPIALLLAWFLELDDDGIRIDSTPTGTPRPEVHGARRYADVVIIGLLLIAVAVLLVRQSDVDPSMPLESPVIAVLPFANLSGDPEQAYFADGLAEELLDQLGRVPGLRVV
ncbi:MAG: repeat-containing protein, partial [Burkholderiaceae bacterium]|nr:repeat-containing protein [Burkholderiaceae bacterium]